MQTIVVGYQYDRNFNSHNIGASLMKNSLANVQARRADIERLVDRHGIATVKGLALRLKVSEITIRRDLKILHAMGWVKWHNGLV